MPRSIKTAGRRTGEGMATEKTYVPTEAEMGFGRWLCVGANCPILRSTFKKKTTSGLELDLFFAEPIGTCAVLRVGKVWRGTSERGDHPPRTACERVFRSVRIKRSARSRNRDNKDGERDIARTDLDALKKWSEWSRLVSLEAEIRKRHPETERANKKGPA